MANEGKKVWIFPDLEMPPEGEGTLKGHESLIILNTNQTPAHIRLTLFFADRDPICGIDIEVAAQRVRCLRTNEVSDFQIEIPRQTQYALRLESDVPVVAQYGRLDNRQPNLAFYTVMGYSC